MTKTFFIVLSVIMGIVYLKSKKPISLFIKNIICSAIFLALICVYQDFAQIDLININKFTCLTALILGIPGEILLVLTKLFVI